MAKKLIILACFILFSTMLVIGLSLKNLATPYDLAQPKIIDVAPGDSITKVAQKMKQMNLLHFPLQLVFFARITDLAHKIKAGEYEVNDQDTALTVLDKIVKGKMKHYPITIIEGWTAAQALSAIQQAHGVVTTIQQQDLIKLVDSIDEFKGYASIEGLIFPSTYHYHKGSKDVEIVKRAMQKMQSVLQQAWSERQPRLPIKSAYEALILASIVEKETGLVSERPQIAGVFILRLRKNMRLQSDPTVIYGMGKNYKGNISAKDLDEETPFNTYQIAALPPTPIALPGKAAIEAVLNPKENGMLYFVAKGDGSHVFSTNLNDHNRAVKQYQLNRKKSYRSSPQ